MDNRCYIVSAAQVSCQKPLSDDWMENPVWYQEAYVRAMEPDSRDFIVPSEARRMSRILKRTICTSITALNQSGVKVPDAIVTGTGMGCMENSEKFLIDLSNFGETCLKPTLFMQSTHNTISSLVAIVLKNHGYNNTYSQGGLSFDSALFDAWLQIKTGAIKTALIGAHDEVTPFTALVMKKTHPHFPFVSETSVSAMLSADAAGAAPLCQVASVELLYKPTADELYNLCKPTGKGVLITGINGDAVNDLLYNELIDRCDDDISVVKYKHLFGENFSSSAIAFYVGCRILERRHVPQHMLVSGSAEPQGEINEVVIVNHAGGTAWSVIKLSR